MMEELTFAQEIILKSIQRKGEEQMFQDYEDCESSCEVDDFLEYSDCGDYYYDAEQEINVPC